MTLILKSDVTLNVKALGDKHGVLSVTDWRYMMDFANDQYLQQSHSGSKTYKFFNELVDITRASTAEYFDKSELGYKIAGVDEKRIHFDVSKKRNGLLIERKKINYFLNSESPKTQVVTVPSSTLWMMLWVEGTGSVSITGAGVSTVTGSGTQASPLIFKSTGSISTAINVTVSGTLAYAQLEALPNSAIIGSKIRTTTAAKVREKDNYTVKSSVLSNVFNSSSGTILISVSRDNIIRQETQVGSTNPIVEIKNSVSGDHVSIARVLQSNYSAQDNQELRMRQFFGGTEYPLSILADDKTEETIALSWGYGGLTMARNGKVIASSAAANFTPNVLELGSSSSWTGVDAKLDGLVTKLALYDRKLSYKELETVTQSW